MVGSDCYGRHSEERIGKEAKVEEEELPQKFLYIPVKAHREIHHGAVGECLNQHMWKLNCYLQRQK